MCYGRGPRILSPLRDDKNYMAFWDDLTLLWSLSTMDGEQIRELRDRENWQPLYIHCWPPELCSRRAWQMLAPLQVTEMSTATCHQPMVEHQTQYGVCKEPQAGTGKEQQRVSHTGELTEL